MYTIDDPLPRIDGGESATAAWEQMRSARVRHLIVTARDKPIGVISALDLGGPAGSARRVGRCVLDLIRGRL